MYKTKNLSIADGLKAYLTYLKTVHSPKKANEIFQQTITAITRYTIPGWDKSLQPKGKKMTKKELAAAQKFLEETPITKMADALKVQEQVFNLLGNTKSSSFYTYGNRTEVLVTWLIESNYITSENPKSCWHSSRSPKYSFGHGRSDEKSLTGKKRLPPYGLKLEQAPEKLKNELQELEKFMTAFYYPGRKSKPVKKSVLESHLSCLLRMFGWMLSTQRASLETLSLYMLVPRLEKDSSKDEHEKVTSYIDQFLGEFVLFLKEERQCRSYHVLADMARTLIWVGRLHYVDISKHPRYDDIPAMMMLRERLNEWTREFKNQPPVIDISLKWLELDEIFTKIIDPLIDECNYRAEGGNLRQLRTIAVSFMRYVVFGMMLYRPPRRQQERIDLRLTLACPINNKPGELKPNQFIHPLPSDRHRYNDYGYLHKKADGKWYENRPAESYKTGKSFGLQELEVPNPVLKNGKCFYEYLEAYLYGYYRDPWGNWISCGEATEAPRVDWQSYSLRLTLLKAGNEHDFVFMTPYSGQPFNTKHFASFFKDTTHRLTGQALTPHLLRDIFATWFLDNGYSSATIDSLAHAMGHSTKTLRRLYDRRHPSQKNRPIEQEMTHLINQLTSGESINKEVSPKIELDLELLLSILTPEQREKLGLK
jgi:hypothetical protein